MSDVAERQGRIGGRHVLAMLVGFFLVVFAVNIIMAVLAVTTFAGLDGEDSYRRGIDYNRTLSEAQKQAKLGWHSTVTISHKGRLLLTFSDAGNAPLVDLKIAASLASPTTDRFDRVLDVHETAPGQYEAELGAIAGNWVVTADVRRVDAVGSPPIYRLKERLWLK